MKTGRFWGVAVFGVGLAMIAAATVPPETAPTPLTGSRQIILDLDAADARIDSAHLAGLPAAAIRAPVLKQLLSEEFAFYYQELDTRLDLAGTLKRLAFERDLTLPDRLVDSIFDEPAQVSFWRAQDGRPRYWLLDLRRNHLERLVEFLAKASLADRQFSQVGNLAVAGGPVALYALKLSNRETLLLASHGDRLVAVSHPGMVLAEDGAIRPAAARALAARLSRAEPAAGQDAPEHRLSLDARLFGFGYERLIAGLEALRFDYRDGAWSAAAQLAGAGPDALAGLPWNALPYDAAYCVGLPIDRREVAELTGAAAAPLAGAAAACWYEDGRWQAPLFAARLASPEAAAGLAPVLGKLFGDWIGAYEANQADGRFPVRSTTGKHGETLWRRAVGARYGDRAVDPAQSGEFEARRYFDVSLAVAGDTVLFSPSAALVDKALDARAKQFPAMAERLPAGRPVLFAVDPARLGGFLRATTLDALPGEREPALRRIADLHLLPRFEALAGERARAAVLPARPPEGTPWRTLEWLELK